MSLVCMGFVVLVLFLCGFVGLLVVGWLLDFVMCCSWLLVVSWCNVVVVVMFGMVVFMILVVFV